MRTSESAPTPISRSPAEAEYRRGQIHRLRQGRLTGGGHRTVTRRRRRSTIDFIVGNSAVVLQKCVMLVRQPLANQQNIVTAQGRKERRHEGAIILHNCTIAADEGFAHANWSRNPSFLGRPWNEFSHTFVLQSQIDELFHPDGWLSWFSDFGLRTSFYTEFDNRGPGSKKDRRVTWKGIKTIDYQHALQFTVESFLRGNTWIRSTGIPYIPSVLPAGSMTTPVA